jgi:hypothetical protein
MLTKYLAIGAVIVAATIGLAACGGGSNQPSSASSLPATAEPLAAGGASGTVLAGHVLTGHDFVGMTLDQAGSFAQEQGRQWRVGREDGVDLPVTADFVSGRVTFTVADNVVTAATIEDVDQPNVG